MNFRDNLCQWNGGPGPHYETWFLTLNDKRTGRGFWFRYSLHSPKSPTSDLLPAAEIWATVFDRQADQNFGLVKRYEMEEFDASGRDNFEVRIGDGRLTGSEARGAISDGTHSISWNLSFEPGAQTYHPLKPWLTRLVRSSSHYCSPNLDTRFSGRVVVDGKETWLESEPGCQSHLWGEKRPDGWVWAHANAFEGHPGTVFEGLGVRRRVSGRWQPALLSLFLRHRDEEHRFVRLRMAEQWRRHLGIGFWTFSAMNTGMYIEGSAQCRFRDMVQVQYRDPDGEPLHCINSEVGNMKIRLFRRVAGVRWRHVETIAARSTTHLEHASRSAIPEVERGVTGNYD